MYGKLFSSMYDGTLATKGPWEALVTFQQLLILCDKDGVVDMTTDAISRRTTIPIDIIERGIVELLKPDDGSRTPDENGRRILHISDTRTWGWQIVNHSKYRAIRSQEERREYMRQYQKNRRANIQKQPIRKRPETPIDFPGLLDRPTFEEWIKSRPARARSKAAQKAAIAKLATWKARGHDPNFIVATSLSNGWQGIFEPDAARAKQRTAADGPVW